MNENNEHYSVRWEREVDYLHKELVDSYNRIQTLQNALHEIRRGKSKEDSLSYMRMAARLIGIANKALEETEPKESK